MKKKNNTVDLLIAGCMFTAIKIDEDFYYVEDDQNELAGMPVKVFKIWRRGRWMNNPDHRQVKVLKCICGAWEGPEGYEGATWDSPEDWCPVH